MSHEHQSHGHHPHSQHPQGHHPEGHRPPPPPPPPPGGNPLEKIFNVVANLIETAAQEGERVFRNGPPGGPAGNPSSPGSARVIVPPVDVIETPDEVLVLVDLPGVEPQAIEVTLVGNMLTIQGSCPVSLMQPGQTVHRTERPVGRFERSLPLPCPVDGAQVSAHSNQGVLTIRLTRQRPEAPRPIQVKVQPVGQPPG